MSQQPPTVSLLPPDPTLTNDHHGPASPTIALPTGTNPANDQTKPSVFHNPWPSYRMASLSDAWLAYQRGAAIAGAQLEPDLQRMPSRSGSVKSRSASSLRKVPSTTHSRSKNTSDEETGLVDIDSGSPPRPAVTQKKDTTSDFMARAGSPFYDPADDNEEDELADSEISDYQDAEEDDPLNPVDIDWPQVHPPAPVNGYVRPVFRRVLSHDDLDDWREPPVCVMRPQWLTDQPSNDFEIASTSMASPSSPSLSAASGAPNAKGKQKATGPEARVTWLGHASVLVEIPWNEVSESATSSSCGVLFDPIFSLRCSPSQLVGPARQLDPPCRVDELPPIHMCCISHDHYDHLDYNSIMDLWAYHQPTVHFFVPYGLSQWFIACGIPEQRVTELDWYHEALVSFPKGSEEPQLETTYPPDPVPPTVDPSAALTLKVAFTPAQHRTGRGLFDHMTSLWGSWCVGVVGPERAADAMRPGMADWDDFKVFFGGDTGYRYATAPEGDSSAICPAFGQIGQRFGPFSLALLPLATGSSLPFLRSLLSLSLDQYTLTSSLHCSPSDSIDIHQLLKAKRSVGMHWGTFCDVTEARATRVEFGRARRMKRVGRDWEQPGESGVFVVVDIGEALVIDI